MNIIFNEIILMPCDCLNEVGSAHVIIIVAVLVHVAVNLDANFNHQLAEAVTGEVARAEAAGY
jgi:hypothetical protein